MAGENLCLREKFKWLNVSGVPLLSKSIITHECPENLPSDSTTCQDQARSKGHQETL